MMRMAAGWIWRSPGRPLRILPKKMIQLTSGTGPASGHLCQVIMWHVIWGFCR